MWPPHRSRSAYTPPPGELGVTINDGAHFTNKRRVRVGAVWPTFATTVLLSNDGGFASPGIFPVAAETPWELDSSGEERLPKTIYARFRGGQSGPETYQDDIILDQTPPVIKAVRASRSSASGSSRAGRDKKVFRIKVRAKDKTSGVAKMRIGKSKRKAGKWKKYKRTTKYRSGGRKAFIQVRDRAKNRSKWEKVQLP